MKRLIVGITGASGSIYAVDLLERLHEIPEIEVHLVMSKWAEYNLRLETGREPSDIAKLADRTYPIGDLSADISSGSFLHDGMVVVPASMKTVAAIATGYGGNLIHRAADVTIKEHRPLVLVPRETPLSAIHLRNLLELARLGVVILPSIPGFYSRPQTIAELIAHQTSKTLDELHIPNELSRRWHARGRVQAEPLRDHDLHPLSKH